MAARSIPKAQAGKPPRSNPRRLFHWGAMTIKMLKPRVQMLTAKPIAAAPVVKRTRGSSWMVIRDRILRRDNGLCQCDECKAAGRLLIAHQVDHIVELADGGTDADSNLRAINHDCHALKTKASMAARRAR